MIVVDVEASGTEYHKHSIVSIGALDFDNPKNRFYEECRIWEGAHVMDEALKVNGFTMEEITDPSKKSETEVVQLFVDWAHQIEDRTFAGQNVSFDRDFIKAGAERGHINWDVAYRTIDVHTLTYMHMSIRGIEIPMRKNHSAINLDYALNYVGIPDEPAPHNALTGALSHAEVISRVLCGKKLLTEFMDFEIPLNK